MKVGSIILIGLGVLVYFRSPMYAIIVVGTYIIGTILGWTKKDLGKALTAVAFQIYLGELLNCPLSQVWYATWYGVASNEVLITVLFHLTIDLLYIHCLAWDIKSSLFRYIVFTFFLLIVIYTMYVRRLAAILETETGVTTELQWWILKLMFGITLVFISYAGLKKVWQKIFSPGDNSGGGNADVWTGWKPFQQYSGGWLGKAVLLLLVVWVVLHLCGYDLIKNAALTQPLTQPTKSTTAPLSPRAPQTKTAVIWYVGPDRKAYQKTIYKREHLFTLSKNDEAKLELISGSAKMFVNGVSSAGENFSSVSYGAGVSISERVIEVEPT